MSEPPLVVDKPAMETLIRLKQTAQVLTSEQRYALPPSGGSGAERELRRVRALLDYVVSGELPKKSTLEVPSPPPTTPPTPPDQLALPLHQAKEQDLTSPSSDQLLHLTQQANPAP